MPRRSLPWRLRTTTRVSRARRGQGVGCPRTLPRLSVFGVPSRVALSAGRIGRSAAPDDVAERGGPDGRIVTPFWPDRPTALGRRALSGCALDSGDHLDEDTAARLAWSTVRASRAVRRADSRWHQRLAIERRGGRAGGRPMSSRESPNASARL